MKKCLLILGLLMTSVLQAVELVTPENRAINSFSPLLVGVTNVEDPTLRKISHFTVGIRDIMIVTFTASARGSNNYQNYMAAFEKDCVLDAVKKGGDEVGFQCTGEPAWKFVAWQQLADSGDLSPYFRKVDTSTLKFDGGKFTFKMFFYKNEDAMCCPSVERMISYHLKENHFEEVVK